MSKLCRNYMSSILPRIINMSHPKYDRKMKLHICHSCRLNFLPFCELVFLVPYWEKYQTPRTAGNHATPMYEDTGRTHNNHISRQYPTNTAYLLFIELLFLDKKKNKGRVLMPHV